MSDLAIKMRPKSFDSMIGVDKLVQRIKDQVTKRKSKRAWLLSGQAGSGKTTIARIMSVAFQCRHVDFGQYCSECYHNRHAFDITEIYGSKYTGIDAIKEILDGYVYHPNPGSRNKVYIINEVHRLSKNAQDLMLEHTEECPRRTRFILTTTEPDMVLRALRQRCEVIKIPPLGLDDIRKLVKKVLHRERSEKSSEDLTEKLMEKNITSARLVVNATQKYVVTDADADEASNVDLGGVDVIALFTCIRQGQWEEVARYLDKVEREDVSQIKRALQTCLKNILLGDSEFSKRTDIVADSILKLHMVRDEVPAVSAVLYNLCKKFSNYKR